MIATTLGGIGLFLLGMTLLTDGLKALAGAALRQALVRFAGGPKRAVASGALLTALVQSSSATTLATIGFVSAGLLTLQQAIGIVLGANLGTTSTAWIVSIVGFKLSMGTIAMPLVGVGALAKILGRDRVSAAGTALAGFGLVFVGIDALQSGMAGLSEVIDTGSLPGATFGGRMVLVLIGAVMTVVMQSSSAAVATTLAAVESQTINLNQAAALVIGQNIGTTVTAGLAAIGASVPAKRTAAAHAVFNLVTGGVALVLLPAFVGIVSLASEQLHGNASVTLSLFHTVFNVVGIAIFVPKIAALAAFVERIVPEQRPTLTRHLDPSVTQVAAVAVEVARRTLIDVGAVAVADAHRVVGPCVPPQRLDEVFDALSQTRLFLGRLRSEVESRDVHDRHLDVLHAIDHLEQLAQATRSLAHNGGFRSDAPGVADAAAAVDRMLEQARDWFAVPDAPAPVERLEQAAAAAAEQRRTQRAATLEGTARGGIDPEAAAASLAAMLAMEHVARHLWRAVLYLDPRRG